MREALAALADGMPRLIALSPDPAKDRRPGVLVFPMTCHSGGTVDIYLEPVLPPSRFLVFGVSPVARALSRVAAAMGFAVDVADPAAERAMFPDADRLWTEASGPAPSRGGSPFAVVATMGERDEEAVLAALAAEPEYLGVVASAKRFAQIRESLLARGASAAGPRPHPEPRRPRHRRAHPRGDRGQRPGGDRSGAAEQGAPAGAARPARRAAAIRSAA